MKGPEFYVFICELLQEYHIDRRKYFFIFNNAKAHYNKQYNQVFKKHINLLFLSAYLEYCGEKFLWSERQAQKTRYKLIRDKYNKIAMRCQNRDEHKLEKYLNHSVKYMEKGLECLHIHQID